MIGDAEAERTSDMATADLLLGIETRARRLRELADAAAPASLLRSAVDFAGLPQPAPVLWRDPGSYNAHDPEHCDAVLSIGEVVSARAPPLWKSPALPPRPLTWACPLPLPVVCTPRPAPSSLVSYEDAPARIAARLRWAADSDVSAGIVLWSDPEPLWTADPDTRGASRHGPQWDALWREIRTAGARLVVIDPVSAALADVSTAETGPVRVLRALSSEAAPNQDTLWDGCGVLMVATTPNSARDAVRHSVCTRYFGGTLCGRRSAPVDA